MCRRRCRLCSSADGNICSMDGPTKDDSPPVETPASDSTWAQPEFDVAESAATEPETPEPRSPDLAACPVLARDPLARAQQARDLLAPTHLARDVVARARLAREVLAQAQRASLVRGVTPQGSAHAAQMVRASWLAVLAGGEVVRRSAGRLVPTVREWI